MSRESETSTRRHGAVAAWFDPEAFSSGNRDWVLGSILVCAVIVVYQSAWNAGFIWDDDVYITRNTLLSAPDGLRRIWFSSESPSQYFPLTYTVFRMGYAIWGLNPAGYHWVNILLHAANALLVWRLLRRLDVSGAWLAAAIWALHPIQVESVAWVTELKNVLMCFFFLLTLRAWIWFVEEESGRRWNGYALALLLYALALFSKTTACTLPAALLLILWLKGRPIDRHRIAQIIPFAVFGIGMGLLTVWWERHHMGTQGEVFAMGMMDRILLACRAVWFYAGKLLWPVNLMFSYPRWTISTFDPLAYLWLVATVGCGVAIFYARRHVGRGVEVAAVFYVATLSPVLGFIMLYTFFYSFVADHYQYVASIGLIALVSAGIAGVANSFNRRNPWLAMVLCASVLLALGTLSWRQARIYLNVETLWTDTVQKNPNSWLAHNNLGNALTREGNVDKGIAHYERVLQIKPDYAQAHFNLGNALVQKGSLGEAIAHYQMALQIKPDYLRAESNLAFLLATSPQASLRNGHQAVELAQQANELVGGENSITLRALAAAYAEAGRFGDAVRSAQKAVELARAAGQPDLVTLLNGELKLYAAGLPFHQGSR